MANKKEYILKIIWCDDEVSHLSEQYSELDKFNFEVDGKLIEVPESMYKYLNNCDDTLGVS